MNREVVPGFVGGRAESLLFAALVASAIAPLWSTPLFPSQDGPIHLWIVHLLTGWSTANATVGQFIMFNPSLEPNVGFYLLAYPFAKVVGVYFAEKMVLSLYAVLFCYGVRYAVWRVNPASTAISFLAIPISFNFFVHMGFYNFILGTALFAPAFVVGIEQWQKRTVRGLATIGAIGLVLVLAHLLAFAIFAASIGTYVVAYRLMKVSTIRGLPAAAHDILADGLRVTAALMPALGVTAAFFMRHGVDTIPVAAMPRELLGNLLVLHVLASFDDLETWLVSAPVGLLLLAFGVAALHQGIARKSAQRTAWSLLVVLLALSTVYLFLPLRTRGVLANDRVAVFMLLVGILWLAAFPWKRAARFGLIAACAAIVLGSAGLRVSQYSDYHLELQEYLAGIAIVEPSSTLLRVRLDANPQDGHGRRPRRGMSILPFLHAASHYSIQKDAVYLGSTLMSPAKYSYFPLVYRQSADPFRLLGRGIERRYPQLDFERFRLETGKPVDYILVVGRDSRSWIQSLNPTYEAVSGALGRYPYTLLKAVGDPIGVEGGHSVGN
jgi:hypothetical protein